MTEPERPLSSARGFSRRIKRRYVAPVPEPGQPELHGEPFVPMGFVRHPAMQVSALRSPDVATRIVERTVEPALSRDPNAVTSPPRSTDQVAETANETSLWPEVTGRTTVEPMAPFVPVAPEPPPDRTIAPVEAPVRRAFTVDEVRRALQRPGATPPGPQPVQREERQAAQRGQVDQRTAQDVQVGAAPTRPRPVSRLYEQPVQPTASEQPATEPTGPTALQSPTSGGEPSAGAVPSRSTDGAGAQRATTAAEAPQAPPVRRRQTTPDVPDRVSRAVADIGDSAEIAPAVAPIARGQGPEAESEQRQPATDGTVEPAISRALVAPGGRSLARPESPGPVAAAVPPTDDIQRAQAVSLSPEVRPPITAADGGPAREPTGAGVRPFEGQTSAPQGTLPDQAEIRRAPEMTPLEPSEVGPVASGESAEPYESGIETAGAPSEVQPEAPVGREGVPESALPEIRRTPAPSGSRTNVPGTAATSTAMATPAASDAPSASLDLAAAYRAQLARYAAETQASAEAGEPGFGPEPAALPDERATMQPAGMPTLRDEVGRMSSPAVPTPIGARTPPPSPITGPMRRETLTAGQEPSTDAVSQMPPATYDSARAVRRQPVRLDQALGVSSSPASPAVSPSLPVRRTVTQGDTSRAESATEATPAAASPAQAPVESGPDIDELAERVFAKLRDRLRVERERLGGTRVR